MSKSPRESENSKEILTVRIGAQMSEEIEEIAEESETKSEGYRKVLSLGLEAEQYDRTPSELREYADQLEEELSRSLWDRLSWPLRITISGAFLTVVALVPIVASFAAGEFFDMTTEPGGLIDMLIFGGILGAIVGVGVFVIGVAGVLVSALYQATRPDIE